MIIDTYQIIGWIGVAFVVLAYCLHLKKKLKNEYVLYHFMNFLGASGVIISSFMTKSWPSMFLFIMLLGISIYFIFKILKIKPNYKELN